MSTAQGGAPRHLAESRATRLFLALAGFFIADALIAEFVGVKIFSLERTLGIGDVQWNLLGVGGTLNFTAGVVYWPVVFVLTDLINEYFGRKGVRLVSWLAVAFISLGLLRGVRGHFAGAGGRSGGNPARPPACPTCRCRTR